MPTWAVLAAAIGVLYLLRRCLGVGRVEGFCFALHTIVVVADKYNSQTDSILAPHEQDVAEALNVALPDLIDGYAKQQARAVDAAR